MEEKWALFLHTANMHDATFGMWYMSSFLGYRAQGFLESALKRWDYAMKPLPISPTVDIVLDVDGNKESLHRLFQIAYNRAKTLQLENLNIYPYVKCEKK